MSAAAERVEVPAWYAPAPALPPAGWRRTAVVAAVVALHGLLLVLLAVAAVRPELPAPVPALAVRLIELTPPAPARVEPPKPLPPKAAAPRQTPPPPVLAAAASAHAAPSFVVAPQAAPVAMPSPPEPVAPAPLPLTAARFDADYLQNPKPAYPPLSRRQGEEGKVVLRVRVSRDGLPLAVEIRQSSGFARLDDAARAAVERWKFVPARQGDEAVEASVLVPLNFTLSN